MGDKIIHDLHEKCGQRGDGGFGGGIGQQSHVCSTYAAVATIAIIGRLPHWLDVNKIKSFLFSIKNADGSFRTTPSMDSETDARSTYCALCLARLIGRLNDPEIRRGAGECKCK